jgi:hypothetical protein
METIDQVAADTTRNNENSAIEKLATALDTPVVIPEPVEVPDHILAAASAMTPDAINAAYDANLPAPADPFEAALAQVDRRLREIEAHIPFVKSLLDHFAGKI